MAKKEVVKDAATAKNPALESALAQIQKQFGKEAIMKMGDGSQQSIEAISSGSLGLDIALGIGGGALLKFMARNPVVKPHWRCMPSPKRKSWAAHAHILTRKTRWTRPMRKSWAWMCQT